LYFGSIPGIVSREAGNAVDILQQSRLFTAVACGAPGRVEFACGGFPPGGDVELGLLASRF
jgi:hypothetical protein